jgi:hypothetical protein
VTTTSSKVATSLDSAAYAAGMQASSADATGSAFQMRGKRFLA